MNINSTQNIFRPSVSDAKKGKFVVSLDFELFWGVRGVKTFNNYGENIIGVHKILPKMLQLFKEYDLKVTFSIVGLLFLKNKDEIIDNIPNIIPLYQNKNLSPYNGHLDFVGDNYDTDKYHYAGGLIEQILRYKVHEIGTHTFSHYLCLEKGQTVEAFEDDLKCAIKIANSRNINITSLVFPKNQFDEKYLQICKKFGIIAYRGNENSWIYKNQNPNNQTIIRRGLRILDTYINLTGHHCYSLADIEKDLPINIAASRFLRPYHPIIGIFDFLKLHRIKAAMTYAAKYNQIYHLWWHPHNFGIHQHRNLTFLKNILNHYSFLNKKYGFKSVTMSDMARHILEKDKI